MYLKNINQSRPIKCWNPTKARHPVITDCGHRRLFLSNFFSRFSFDYLFFFPVPWTLRISVIVNRKKKKYSVVSSLCWEHDDTALCSAVCLYVIDHVSSSCNGTIYIYQSSFFLFFDDPLVLSGYNPADGVKDWRYKNLCLAIVWAISNRKKK